MEGTARLNVNRKTIEEAQPAAKEILAQVQQQLGIVPNLYAFMAHAPGLLETYIRGQEIIQKDSGFTPAEQEVILLSISFENGCEYCMAADCRHPVTSSAAGYGRPSQRHRDP